MKMQPMEMLPAYRFGAQTPWGGDGLKKIFGKDIPDQRTGESLEVSAIPGLESRTPDGKTLTRWIEEKGAALTGTAVTRPFPLLLKLLDARDTLSVQVHPDDAYAARVEGKLGKTEAWVILHAEEGAKLVYGVRQGTTREVLEAASRAGAAVENVLRRVNVHAGEVYYIPAGLVHALGRGIVLYEIQQSSDVTYRFYDWERRDQDGNKRALHIDKALDVVDLSLQPEAAQPVPLGEGRQQLLHEKYFSLQRWQNTRATLIADPRMFRILTAVGRTHIAWPDGEMELLPGRTALLPADGYDLTIETEHMLLAYPTVD